MPGNWKHKKTMPFLRTPPSNSMLDKAHHLWHIRPHICNNRSYYCYRSVRIVLKCLLIYKFPQTRFHVLIWLRSKNHLFHIFTMCSYLSQVDLTNTLVLLSFFLELWFLKCILNFHLFISWQVWNAFEKERHLLHLDQWLSCSREVLSSLMFVHLIACVFRSWRI